MTKQSKIILEKKCNESFCAPGSILCSLPKIPTRLFLECCDRMNLVPFLLGWILGWDFSGEVQTQLGLGSLGQDCFRRCTITLNVLKQESKCPAGVWAVPRGSHRAQKVSLPLSMDLVQSFPAAGQKSLDPQARGNHQELFWIRKNRRLLAGKSFLEQSRLEWC